MYRLVLALLAVFAMAAVYFPVLTNRQLESSQSYPSPKMVEPIKPVVSGKPVRLTIPRLGIDIDVIEGVYNPTNRTWTLGKKTAQYATNTPLVNDTAGNTFIYGHNNQYVFASLPKITSDDEVVVTTAEGVRFYYRFKISSDVNPHEVEAIKYQGPPILTLQTCVGGYFEQRRLFKFDFIKSEV
jgi:LPXTG-site transpeptidase (sortase) family protein